MCDGTMRSFKIPKTSIHCRKTHHLIFTQWPHPQIITWTTFHCHIKQYLEGNGHEFYRDGSSTHVLW
jgi:hypothetical protein